MIIGHIGVAFAAKRRWAEIPLVALLLGTFAPDLVRELLADAGLGWRTTNHYSHGLPWCLLLALAAALLAWQLYGSRSTGLVIGGIVLSHVALDLISGNASRSAGSVSGLDVESFQQLEFLVESVLLLGGWWLIRGTRASRWVRYWACPALLIAIEGTYLLGTMSRRPYATRCLASPISGCSDRSLLTQRWNTTPWW